MASSSRCNLKQISDDLGLTDLGFIRKRFTWNNRRSGICNIQERIDRGLANDSWRILFPHANITHLVTIKSDHCPLLLQTSPPVHHLPRPFRFESMWILHLEIADVIQEAWQRHPTILSKLKTTKITLKDWNKQSFGHLQTKITTLKDMIMKIQDDPQHSDNIQRELMIAGELDGLLAQEEHIWKDKAKAKWSEDGDANTHYFHLTTIIHRNHNTIHRIMFDHNTLLFDRGQIGKAFELYYSHLFTSVSPSFSDSLQDLIPHQISAEANSQLERVLAR